ncbi:MAG: hypothetical protein U0354_20950 [Candidatus Sericytochromatia bacterium]
MEEIYELKTWRVSEPRKSKIKEMSFGLLSGNEKEDLEVFIKPYVWKQILIRNGIK